MVIPDLFMVFNFLPRDLYNLHIGKLEDGAWCKASAFVAITAIVALNFGAVIIAYCTLRWVTEMRWMAPNPGR
jgi:hypothetical protein